MPLNTVQQFVRGELDGMTSTFFKPAQAWVKPPVPGTKAGAPQIYIWSSHGSNKRQTFPRGSSIGPTGTAGFRWITHDLEIWLYHVGMARSKTDEQGWPAFVDQVVNILINVVMPQEMTDPATGQITQLIAIAEQVDFDLAPVASLSAQRLLHYAATLTVDLVEQVQG